MGICCGISFSFQFWDYNWVWIGAQWGSLVNSNGAISNYLPSVATDPGYNDGLYRWRAWPRDSYPNDGAPTEFRTVGIDRVNPTATIACPAGTIYDFTNRIYLDPRDDRSSISFGEVEIETNGIWDPSLYSNDINGRISIS